MSEKSQHTHPVEEKHLPGGLPAHFIHHLAQKHTDGHMLCKALYGITSHNAPWDLL